MNNDLKSTEALKAYAREVLCGQNPTNSLLIRMFDEIIDNAPTCNNLQQNCNNLQGEWIRKEDVIHSIAKQYSEHNELVPIWLNIGDLKGGAE